MAWSTMLERMQVFEIMQEIFASDDEWDMDLENHHPSNKPEGLGVTYFPRPVVIEAPYYPNEKQEARFPNCPVSKMIYASFYRHIRSLHDELPHHVSYAHHDDMNDVAIDYFDHWTYDHVVHFHLFGPLTTKHLQFTNIRHLECRAYDVHAHDKLYSLHAKHVQIHATSCKMNMICASKTYQTHVPIDQTPVTFLDVRLPSNHKINDHEHNVPNLTLRWSKLIITHVPSRVRHLRLVCVEYVISRKVTHQCKIYHCTSQDYEAQPHYKYWSRMEPNI